MEAFSGDKETLIPPLHSSPELHALSLPLISTPTKGSSLGPRPPASAKQQSQRDYELPVGKKSSSATSSLPPRSSPRPSLVRYETHTTQGPITQPIVDSPIY